MPQTCTTPFAACSCLPPIACDLACAVDDFTLTPAERSLLSALRRHDVRFLVVGLGAAVIEGAPVSTQDLDRTIDGVAVHVLPLERPVVP